MSKVRLSTVLSRGHDQTSPHSPPSSEELDLAPRFQEEFVERDDWDAVDDSDIHGVRRASRARKI